MSDDKYRTENDLFSSLYAKQYADGGVVLLEHPYLLRFEWELQAAAVDRILMPDVTVETIGIVPDRK